MIVDFRADPDHALLYDIIDTATGRSMYDQPIFYANDATGVYRLYRRNAKGVFYVDPANPDEAAWEERWGNFRLVLKAEVAGAPETDRPETWRDRRGML